MFEIGKNNLIKLTRGDTYTLSIDGKEDNK